MIGGCGLPKSRKFCCPQQRVVTGECVLPDQVAVSALERADTAQAVKNRKLQNSEQQRCVIACASLQFRQFLVVIVVDPLQPDVPG